MSPRVQNILIIALAVVVASLSLMPEKSLSQLYVLAGSLLEIDPAWIKARGWRISNGGHFLASFLLTLFGVVRFRQRRWLSYTTVLLFLGSIEYLQNYLPTRQATWEDFSYAFAGSLLGLLLVVVGTWRLKAGKK